VLLYLQGEWQPEYGGCFRMYTEDGVDGGEAPDGVSVGDGFVDIAPLGGRLLAFWSDSMVHSVCESFALGGDESHRWALTVWLHTDDASAIHYDPAAEARHFPGLQGPQRELAG
jgi:Rps23 Pro-64 3,4-dihydroxylase Tpa1-like proline 4-hydroxylase